MALGNLIYSGKNTVTASGSIAYQKRNPTIRLRRHEILDVLVDFAESHKGATPSKRDLLALFNANQKKVARKKRKPFEPMSWSTFRKHFTTLEKDDKIIEFRDGVIVINYSHWRPGARLKKYLS